MVNHTIYIYIIRNADAMTDTMNKSKLRGDLDGGSGSIVITAGSEGRGQRAEGRGQRAEGRQQTRTRTRTRTQART